jgi:selenocysteine lyase/cysteine desulfurase
VAESTATDPGSFRGLFPALTEHVHLASCSLGARSVALDESLGRMLSAMSRAPGSAAWVEFEQEIDRARARFAALIGARSEQVAVMPNASVSAFQVISTIALGTRDTIVSSVGEFPSIAQVWLAQRSRGARVLRAGGRGYDALVDHRTALVSVPLVTYDAGALQPVARVARTAHAHGCPVFVDAYQAVGVLPVDVRELDCDYLVAGTHKYLLGLPGVAFLYVRDPAAGGLEPTLTGWFGRVDPFAFDACVLDFPESARRFQTGTAAVPSIYAASAGLDLVERLDLDDVRRHVQALVETAGRLLSEQGEVVHLPEGAAGQGAHFGFTDPAPDTVGRWLAERGIAVSPRGGLVRLSFHYYNDVDDVQRLCTALRAYRARRPTTPGRAG